MRVEVVRARAAAPSAPTPPRPLAALSAGKRLGAARLFVGLARRDPTQRHGVELPTIRVSVAPAGCVQRWRMLRHACATVLRAILE